MDLHAIIGQRLVFGFQGPALTESFRQLVRQYKIGNVILFRHNVVDNAQLRALCTDIQQLVQSETGHPAFITIDQEGGMVSRLGADAVVTPGNMAVAATGDPVNARIAAQITARQLRGLGINLNLAPVLDVNSNARNPVIGVRSFGDDPTRVADFAREAVLGYQNENVCCCGKHFPGHGDTAVDSHLGLPCIDRSFDELMQRELKPFIAGIEAGAPAVMTTHILFPQIEPEHIPATMSRRIVTGLLRGEMSFTGLVTSDCMEMQAVQKFFGSVNGVLAAMNAGVDLVLLSHTTLLSGEAAKAAAEALQSGKLDRKEMEESVDRILAAKAKLAAVPAAAFDAEQAAALNDKLLRATITEVHVPKAGRPNVGGHPLCLGCQVYRTGLVGNVVDDVQQSFPVMMAKALGGDGFTTPIDPSEDEIYEWVRRAESYTSIVIGTYNGHLHSQQLELTKALAEHSGKPVIVVALRNPYDLFPLPETIYTLAAYEYTARSTAAVADVLLGRHAATGRLPIATPEQEAQ